MPCWIFVVVELPVTSVTAVGGGGGGVEGYGWRIKIVMLMTVF